MRPVLEYGSSVCDRHTKGIQGELEKVQNRAARFIATNYAFEEGSMIGVFDQLKWEFLKKKKKKKKKKEKRKKKKKKKKKKKQEDGCYTKCIISTDDLIRKIRLCGNNHSNHSMAFQIPSASIN